MQIDRLDHLVLTVKNMDDTVEFYTNVLGMRMELFGSNRKALRFGNQKINLHSADNPIEPHAGLPTSGSADLCFITATPISEFISHLNLLGVEIIDGPVTRTGALGPIISVYLRDPDMNLIELSNYPDPDQSKQNTPDQP
jgi:catechol 2,3-dioxygenase-like lactoylglutathione lyase family enzyme